MDCLDFNKNIQPFLRGELEGGSLNDFLRHFDSCGECADELEISYLVIEGIRILDANEDVYDLRAAYEDLISCSRSVLRLSKRIRRLSYIVGTAAFWAVVGTVIVYFRLAVF